MARVIKAQDVTEAASTRAQLLNLQDLAAQAKQIVLDARRQAAAVLAEARAQAHALAAGQAQQQSVIQEQWLAAVRQQGFEEGMRQGLAQGAQQAAADATAGATSELAEAVQTVREMAVALQQARADLAQQLPRQALSMAMTLAEKIVGRVAAQDIAAAEHNLAKALELAGSGGDIIVRVSPRQYRRLTEHCRELAEAFGCGSVRLMADESVTPGGVKVLCRCGEIDATIETQLANVAASLTGVGGLFVSDHVSDQTQDSENSAKA